MIERFKPGSDAWIASDSPCSSFSAVFEDDGATGYLYAYDRTQSEGAILDALHIYDVQRIVPADRDRESEAEIRWSADGMKAGLLLNQRLHAVIDFAARKGFCRSNFPPPGGAWESASREPWTDELAKLLA